MKKVLVLGCGEMGESAAEDLYNYGRFKEIVIGTRTIEKAKRLKQRLMSKKVKLSIEEIDVNNTAKLESLIEGCDIVVNCIGPNYKYEVPIAKAAIKMKANVVDINDDYQTTFKMFDLNEEAEKAKVLIVLGLGASPGINNVFARAAADQLDEVEEVHTAWVMSGADPGGLALSYHLLYSLSEKALTYQNGKFIEVRSFIDGKETIEFPEPVGKKDVYHVGHPEPITLSRRFKKARIVDNKATFYPAYINNLILSLGQLIRQVKGPIPVDNSNIDPMDFAASYFHEKCKNLKGVKKEGALRVAVNGKKEGISKKIIYSSSGYLSQGTGIAASIGAQMIAQGKIKEKGVLPPEECIDWRKFLKAILSRRIGRLDIKEE